MAVRQANERGGHRGKPFRLVSGWSDNPWGTGVVHVTRMAYHDRVWAIVGGIDGPSTHLAEQVVAKARLVLVNPVSSDKTLHLANVPWVFSLVPGDHLQARELAAAIADRLVGQPIRASGSLVLISGDDHDSHLFAVELKAALARHRVHPRHQFDCRSGDGDVDALTAKVLDSKPTAVAVVAGPDDSARLVKALRDRGFRGIVFGGPAVGRDRFAQRAGQAAEGVVFPTLFDPSAAPASPAGESGAPALAVRREFVGAYRELHGKQPDFAAAHTYDAVRLLIAAIRKAGLNRARIGDALRDLSPWTGVTGTVNWDRTGSNERRVFLGTVGPSRQSPSPPRG
jgi:branched-chain amino acid transport system substrate-binding protein